MKHFIHYKKNNTSFDIVHLSGPRSNYTITENGGTLFYTGKDTKNQYDITDVEKFYWARGETLKSTWAIEYGAYAITVSKLDILGDNSCLVSYSFDPIFDIEISQVNMLDSDTKLLLSGSLSDQTGKTINNVGGVTLSNTQIKNNSKSLFFNGSNYLTVPVSTDYHFSTGDFTVEAWINLNALPTGNIWPGSWSTHMVLFTIGSPSSGDGFGCLIGSTNLSIQTNEAQYSSTIAHNLKINTWYHIAYVRTNGILSFYINGKLLGSQVNCNVSLGTGSGVYIGCETTHGAFFNGYIDDLRVTKGVARYTSDFIPKGILNNVIKSIDNGIITNTQDSYTSLLLSGSLIEKTGKTLTTIGKLNTSSLETKNNNKSIYFDGSSYFTVPTSTDFAFGTGDFTIEMWFNMTQVISDWATLYVTSTSINTPGAITFSVNTTSFGGGVGYGSGASALFTKAYTFNLNTWYHFAASRKNGILNLFINGLLTHTLSNTTNIPTQGQMIGDSQYNTRYFKGYIDDLRVSKGIARYTSNFTPKGLYHGAANNMITTTGKFGDALSFNGNGKVIIPAGGLLPFNTTNFSINFWYKPTSFANTNQTIFGTYKGGSWSTNEWQFGPTHPWVGNKFSLAVYNINSGAMTLVSNTTTVLNTTYHIVITRNNGIISLYINGILDKSVTINNTIIFDNRSNNLPFYLGGPTPTTTCQGELDQFRIFDRALTQTEVTKLFNEK